MNRRSQAPAALLQVPFLLWVCFWSTLPGGLTACPVSDSGGDGDAAATDTSADGGPVTCGELQCDADEYCYIECTCCGIPTNQPPSADYECRPIPTECSADAICSCPEVNGLGGLCDQPSRSVQRPCA